MRTGRDVDRLRLAFSILQRHLEFLVDRHEYFSELEVEPDNLGELFSDSWTREAMSSIVSKGAGDISQVSSPMQHTARRRRHAESCTMGSVLQLGARETGKGLNGREVRCKASTLQKLAHDMLGPY